MPMNRAVRPGLAAWIVLLTAAPTLAGGYTPAEARAPTMADADVVVFLQRAELSWDAGRVTAALGGRGTTVPTVDALIAALRTQARPGDQGIFMCNGGFGAALATGHGGTA